MAGTIEFRNGRRWDASGGAFRGMVLGTVGRLDDSESSKKLRAILMEAVDSNLMFIAFEEELDQEMQNRFAKALAEFASHTKAQGPSGAANSELHEGFVQRLQDLVGLIAQARDREGSGAERT